LGGSVLALVLVLVLSLVAVSSMADSSAGRDAGADTLDPTREFPWTSTALIGVVDDSGAMRAMAVAALTPEGRGGTLLSVSPSADAAAGWSSVLRPFNAVFATDGPEAWRATVEQGIGLSFDVAEVVDASRLAALLDPLGDLPASFPFAFTDASTGTSYDVGDLVLSGPGASRVLNATNATGPDWQLDAARDAVWSAVADRVGAGIGSLVTQVRYDATYPPPTLDDFLDALFAAPVTFRGLSSAKVDESRVGEQLPIDYAAVLGADSIESVVVHSRPEITLFTAAVAPARVGAPADGPTVRLVSGFTSDDAEAVDSSRSDVLSSAIIILQFLQVNVVSVVDAPGVEVPEVSRFLVADDDLIDGVWESFDGVFGEIQVSPASEPIIGVDIEIMLGRDYLVALQAARDEAAAAAADVEGSDS
jgi:CheY-like chemotaxis protein